LQLTGKNFAQVRLYSSLVLYYGLISRTPIWKHVNFPGYMLIMFINVIINDFFIFSSTLRSADRKNSKNKKM